MNILCCTTSCRGFVSCSAEHVQGFVDYFSISAVTFWNLFMFSKRFIAQNEDMYQPLSAQFIMTKKNFRNKSTNIGKFTFSLRTSASTKELLQEQHAFEIFSRVLILICISTYSDMIRLVIIIQFKAQRSNGCIVCK